MANKSDLISKLRMELIGRVVSFAVKQKSSNQFLAKSKALIHIHPVCVPLSFGN